MTIEERDTARAIQAIAKHLGRRAIDWEQRRYEIAKAIIAAEVSKPGLGFGNDLAADAVHLANALIKELQNNPMK